MSFVLNRDDISFDRIRQGLVPYVVLFLTVLAAVFVMLLIAKHFLQQQSLEDVESRLNDYIRESSRSSLSAFKKLDHASLYGLHFVRVTSPREHLLFSQGDIETPGFSVFATSPPNLSGPWISLAASSTDYWTLVAKKYENGLVIQGGRKAAEYIAVYEKLKSISYIFLLFFGLFLWLPVLYMLKRLNEQIVTLTGCVQKGVKSKRWMSRLKPKGAGAEVNELASELEYLLAKNERLIQEMQASLDNVAHDLRTPMTRLRSVAEYALQNEGNREELVNGLADCLEESERVLGMLRTMMSVAEAETGTMKLDRKLCDLSAIAADVVELYEYVALEKNINIDDTACRTGDASTVFVDRVRMTQVVANLVDNAVKYSPANTVVELSLHKQGGKVALKVKDEGMGISVSEQERIWERLYRGDRSRTEKGLGLGLNYVKAVVEMHGGKVEVESHLKQGAEFGVYLPAASE